MKRVCLLTGSSGRLGTAFCRQFASEYAIAAVYRSRLPDISSQLQSTVDPLAPNRAHARNRHGIYAIQSDLENDGEIERVVELALARFGRVDVLVNMAAHSYWGPLVDSNALLDQTQCMLRMNVEIPLRLAATVAARFWRDRVERNRAWNRSVVNVSSISGLCAYPNLGQSVYGASKAALNMLTSHMADEFSTFGVRANALAPNSFPGLVATADVASAVRRLDRGKLTGRIVVVDSDGAWSYQPDGQSMKRQRAALGEAWELDE